MRVELEIDSQLDRTWLELSDQVGNTLESGRKSVLFAISLATAFLCIVSATVTILNRPDLWWVSASLSATGVFILVFIWYLGHGELERHL